MFCVQWKAENDDPIIFGKNEARVDQNECGVHKQQRMVKHMLLIQAYLSV